MKRHSNRHKSTSQRNPAKILEIIHAVYRVANSTFIFKDLAAGLLRIMSNCFSVNYASLVLSYPSNPPFIRATLKEKRNYSFKKRGRKTLTTKEKNIMESGNTYFAPTTVIIPLIFINTIGIITLKKSSAKHPFHDSDKRLLKILGETLSLIIRNFQLYEEQRQTILGTVRALTGFLKRYTPTGSINTEFINKVLKELLHRLSLTKNQLSALEYAVLLHDAGKIEIPQHLLHKDTPLTIEEKEIIRKHPRKGVEMLKDLRALQPVIPIILYHHEKYDGSGYPSGLKKKHIPIEARIMAIIDAFDAMAFGRPYKKRLTLQEAIRELKKNKGTQFDPVIVDVFIQVLGTKEIKKYLLHKLKKV